MKSLRHKVQLARSLSPSNWLTLLKAWWILLGYYTMIHVVSYERLITQLQAKQRKATKRLLPDAEQLAHLVYLASRLHLLPMTCLTRSLTLHQMLGRCGIPSQVKIGTQKTETGINIHAWVEVDGHAIGEPGNVNEHFTSLKSFSSFTSLENN